MTQNEEENSEILEYRVDPSQNGERLDCFVTEKTPNWVSRTMAQNAIDRGKITVNGLTRKSSYRLKANEIVLLEVPAPPVMDVLPENIPLSIIQEEEDFIVLNKPPKMMVHPLPTIPGGTLVNALLYHFDHLPQMPGALNRPGIVHRLDKETSGVMVVAKTMIGLQSLCSQFRERKNRKEYFALLHGILPKKDGRIDLALGRNPKSRLKMQIDPSGKEAMTDYRILSEFQKRVSLARIQIKTGRTHQIRVHFKHLGAPVLGDYLYGFLEEDRVFGLDRQMLHAFRLGFYHPRKNDFIEFQAPLPEDFKRVLRVLSGREPYDSVPTK